MRGISERDRSVSIGSWPLWACMGMFGAVLLAAAETWARTGGGQHYTGGGGGFSGGGGGGDGISGLVIYLLFAHPEIGVPVLIVVVVASLFKHRRNPDNTTYRAVKKLEQIPLVATPSLEPIKKRDAAFDETQFLRRVKESAQKVQDAWNRGNLDPVRPLLSDGLMRRLSTQIQILKNNDIQNIAADYLILDTRIHACSSDDHFDTLHVALRANARDMDMSASLSYEEAMKKAGRAPSQPFVEIWSFLRRPGAGTKKGKGILDGQCPNCGSDSIVGETARCDQCDALVNSGEYDWVLAEITQLEEWKPGSVGKVPGLDRLMEKDASFNRQTAEDRASYLFWRWVESLVTGSAKPLAKVAQDSVKKRVESSVKGGPASLFKVAVGAVDLVACETGTKAGRDRCHVKILWSSARSQKEVPMHQINVLTIGRNASEDQADKVGLSHARCPNCHGPLEENDSPECDYCGEPLDAGDKEWVLEAVIQPEELVLESTKESESQIDVDKIIIPDMGNLRERTLLLMRMAAVVMADGVVTKAERKLLKNVSKRWQVSLEAIEPILSKELDASVVNTMRPSNPKGFLSGLISAALVDGRIDRKEEKLLLDIAKNMEIKEPEALKMMSEMARR